MDTEELFASVGTLVRFRRDKKINDITLYNSILRLIYYSEDWDKKYLKEVVKHLDEWEDKGLLRDIHRQENFIILAQSAGTPYFGGFMRLLEE